MDQRIDDVGIAPTTGSELESAVELLLSGLAEPARGEQRARLLNAGASGPSLDGLLVARREARLVGACLAAVHPGKTASVWPPALAHGEAEATATKLLNAELNLAARRGAQVAQALLDTDAGIQAARFESAGFAHVADLLFLVCGREQFCSTARSDELQFDAYDPENCPRLIEIIERTYVGTRDCPDLNGVRQTADVIEGYLHTGAFDASRWILVRDDAVDVGCLLLTEHPDKQWEIVYVGLVPEARGRGWGRLLIQHAQAMAARADCRQMVLAVDADNEPALRAYASCGFVAWDRRAVYLAKLGNRNTYS
jgi:mycothiol synthase